MCLPDDGGNKVLICTVGDLKPGDQYRTPEGDTLLVLADPLRQYIGGHHVANLQTGETRTARYTIKLGRDRMGRLYASRYLNSVRPDAVVVSDLNTPTDDQMKAMIDQMADDGPHGRIE